MAKKAFNLEEYKAHPDWKVETGKGENVRILTTDMKSDFPILAIIEDSPNHEDYDSYTLEGRNELSIDNPYNDLFLITPEEELTEFENGMLRYLQEAANRKDDSEIVESTKKYAAELLSLAREQLMKDGYVIQRKAFHDTVEKVAPEVMKEISDKVDMEEDLRLEYERGKAETLKDLPRWIPNKFDKHNFETCKAYLDTPRYLCYQDKMIDVSELVEKLPGFKED